MFELEDGRVIDTSEYSEAMMAIFKQKHPNAKPVTQNFQQDPADAETVVGSENNTVSNSEDGLLVSPETEISPLDKLRQKYSKESLMERMPTVQIDNTAVRLPKKIIDPIKIAESNKREAELRIKKLEAIKSADTFIEDAIADSFEVKNGYYDFSNQDDIIKFRDNANSNYIQNNPIIQDEIVPRIAKEKEQDLNDYIEKAKELYNLNNPEDITQENVDAYLADVNEYYSGLLNAAIVNDSQFKEQMRLYNEAMDAGLEPYYKGFQRSEAYPLLTKFTDFTKRQPYIPFVGYLMENVVMKGIVGLEQVNLGLNDAGLKGYETYVVDKIKDVDNANFGKGFEDDRIGYWVPAKGGDSKATEGNVWQFIPEVSDDGIKQAAIVSLGGRGVVKGTWGEFKDGFQDWIAGEDEQLRKRTLEVQNRELLLSGFDNAEFDKILEGEDVANNIIRLASEQLPQMALTLLTFGLSSGTQIGSSIYADGIDAEARKRFNIPEGEEVPVEARREVMKDEDFLDALELKAITGGTVGGLLDRFAAGKVLKPFTITSTKSILRGGYQNFLKGVANGTVNNTKNAALESITETLQETIQMGLSGNKIDGDQLFEAAGTAFLSTMAIGIGGNVKSQSNAEYQTILNRVAGKLNPKSAEAFYNVKIAEIDNLLKNTVDEKTIADLEAKKAATIAIRDANTKIPSNFSQESKEQILELLVEKDGLQNKIKGKDKSLVKTDTNRISEINEQLTSIAATEQVTQNVLKASKPLADIEIEVARTEKQAKQQAGKNSIALDNDATGFISEDGTKIFINQQKAAELGEVNTASHELLHAVLFKTLYNRDADGNVTGNNVVRGLAQVLDEELAKLGDNVNNVYADRLALYKKDPSSVQAEEKLALFADALFYGDIKTNDSVITRIKDFVRRLLQNAGFKNIEFNEGQDVVNFLKDYNRAIERGKLGKAITKAAKEGAVVGDAIRRFQGPEAVARNKANRSIKGLENVKNKLSEIEPNFKSARSQTDIAMELPTMISTQIKNRFQLTNDKLDAFTDDVIGKLYLAQEPTKWDGRGTLYGFLNGRISKRISDVVREEFNRVPQERLYLGEVQNLQADEQVNLAAEETATTQTKERPKFKTLSQSNILPADQKQAIQKKLLSTIRVLKSRLDQGKSINRTVSPLIAEIRKAMGKQADIEFKKRLGPKKNDILRKNYLKFKKPILENMTTTWLMTAMPFAVQKQVNGRFTSDWQGKKIDRETVDTDKAGRTSGADIVRRLPNVANKVTDEQFLSYMFKDNDVIRGRKESLSKAMAEEYSFDLLSEELQNPNSAIRQAFVNNQEALGVELGKNFVQEVERDIERGNVKFNRAGIQGLNRLKLKEWRKGSEKFIQIIDDLNGNYGKNVEKTVLQAIKQVWPGDTFTPGEYKGLAKQFTQFIKQTVKAQPKFTKQKGGTFKDFLREVANDIDGRLSIVAYTGATKSANDLVKWKPGPRDKNGKRLGPDKLIVTDDILDARSIVENVVSKMPIEEAYFALQNTFNSTPGRQDIYQGKDDVVAALRNAGFKFDKVISRGAKGTFIVLNNGKEVKVLSPEGKVTADMLGTEHDVAASKAKAEIAWNTTTNIVKALKQVDPNVQAIILSSMNSGSQTVLREAAPVTWRSKTKPSKVPKDYRYEHAIPARVILHHMYQRYVNGDTSIDIKGLKDDYVVTIIPIEMDDVLRDVGLEQIALVGYTPGVTPKFARYYNVLTRNRIQYAIEEIGNPKNVVGQQFENTYNKLNPVVKKAAPIVVKSDIALEKAFKKSRSLNYGVNPKGITVLDFDDTIAISDSKVIVVMPTNLEGVSKIDQLIKENRLYGPGNRILNYRFEQELLARKKKIKELDTNNSADELRALYKKAKGENKENIKLAIQEKFKALGEDVIADSQIDIYTGEVMKITPAEFAARSTELEAQGAKFDFSEFNKVVKGRKGPLFDLALKRQKKFGNDNIFILTARPQASAKSIQKFAKGLGLDLKLKNITGLEDGSPQAKADWIVGKVNEGFNDFYFADDALKNVKAVQDALNLFDVKSDVQQAKFKFNKSLNAELNKMIERQTGIRAETTYSAALARRRGARKGRYKFFVPYGAEDFRGLTQYVLAGKGKQGEMDQKFLEDNLVTPYVQGIAAMEKARRALKNDYLGLRKMFPDVRKKLGKKIPGMEYTHDQAIRIYLYNKSGFEIDGLSKKDLKQIISMIEKDENLKSFADGLQLISKKDKWVEPDAYWDTTSILGDLNNLSEKINRDDYLTQFNENVDAMFDDKTLNKLEAAYGTTYRDALTNIIGRMKTGINRPNRPGKYERRWLNWVNNSVGTIMFFNRRSGLLQMLSFTNFINWSDNNPIQAAAAFANQPEYWKAWAEIFNSDKLKERRGGLKSDIQEQEIANQARNSRNKASAIIAYLLKIGFTPTQIADSMAIATGGATLLINRTKTYQKQGMNYKEARAKAFEDFSKISDETQQSGDPMLISAQQSSHLGRLVLAFQNTPMQYTRLIKKASQDLINGRGSAKTNISKIAYYGFIQNLIFNGLQQALFAFLPDFDDDDDLTEEDIAKLRKKEDKKIIKTVNGMIDSILRGSGLSGAVVSTLKNTIMRFFEERDKGFTGDQTQTLIELANISPPIGSKLRKVYNAILSDKYDRDVMAERGFEITSGGRLNLSPSYQVIGNLTSAFINLPLDRLVVEATAISEMLDDRNTSWQRLALALGWRTWDVNADNEEEDLLKDLIKIKKEEANKRLNKLKREKKKQDEFDKLAAMSPEEKRLLLLEEARKNSERAKKAAATRRENKRIRDSILRSN